MVFKNLKKAFSSLGKERVLYYPGCVTNLHLKQLLDKYKSLLSDLGIDYIVIPEMKCCGSPLLNAGYEESFQDLMNQNKKLLESKKVSKIITNCPHCFDVFKNIYKLKTEHITQTIEQNKHKLIGENNDEITYHDPCLLAKNGIINQPRAVLKKTGFSFIEPIKTKKKTFCCGAGGGLIQNSPKIADKIAKERIKQFRTKKIVVACPYCYLHLKNNAKNKEILELSEAISED